jgi:hypothetical protein
MVGREKEQFFLVHRVYPVGCNMHTSSVQPYSRDLNSNQEYSHTDTRYTQYPGNVINTVRHISVNYAPACLLFVSSVLRNKITAIDVHAA